MTGKKNYLVKKYQINLSEKCLVPLLEDSAAFTLA